MSKNTNTNNATTNNTMTNNEKGEKSMKKNAVTANVSLSASEFKQKSYDAYLAYVAFIEGKKSITETVESLSEIMTAYGYTLTADNLANTLTVKMTAFGKDKGEQAKKVKSISTFRAFIKGGWKDIEAAPVHSNAGKNPADSKTVKAKKPTKSELEETVKALMAQIASMTATTETATAENKAA